MRRTKTTGLSLTAELLTAHDHERGCNSESVLNAPAFSVSAAEQELLSLIRGVRNGTLTIIIERGIAVSVTSMHQYRTIGVAIAESRQDILH